MVNMTHINIVIFERYDGVRFVLEKALEKYRSKFNIKTYRHKRRIHRLVDQKKVDVLITEMSKLDPVGLELSRYVRKTDQDVNIIWITVVGCHEFRQEMKNLNIAYCFEKPLEVNAFRRSLEELSKVDSL